MHECWDCGAWCHCHGDIDDCATDDEPLCDHCDGMGESDVDFLEWNEDDATDDTRPATDTTEKTEE